MKLLLILLTLMCTACASYNTQDPNLQYDNPVLATCLYKLDKNKVDQEVLDCYINTIEELKQQHTPKEQTWEQ